MSTVTLIVIIVCALIHFGILAPLSTIYWYIFIGKKTPKFVPIIIGLFGPIVIILHWIYLLWESIYEEYIQKH